MTVANLSQAQRKIDFIVTLYKVYYPSHCLTLCISECLRWYLFFCRPPIANRQISCQIKRNDVILVAIATLINNFQ